MKYNLRKVSIYILIFCFVSLSIGGIENAKADEDSDASVVSASVGSTESELKDFGKDGIDVVIKTCNNEIVDSVETCDADGTKANTKYKTVVGNISQALGSTPRDPNTQSNLLQTAIEGNKNQLTTVISSCKTQQAECEDACSKVRDFDPNEPITKILDQDLKDKIIENRAKYFAQCGTLKTDIENVTAKTGNIFDAINQMEKKKAELTSRHLPAAVRVGDATSFGNELTPQQKAEAERLEQARKKQALLDAEEEEEGCGIGCAIAAGVGGLLLGGIAGSMLGGGDDKKDKKKKKEKEEEEEKKRLQAEADKKAAEEAAAAAENEANGTDGSGTTTADNGGAAGGTGTGTGGDTATDSLGDGVSSPLSDPNAGKMLPEAANCQGSEREEAEAVWSSNILDCGPSGSTSETCVNFNKDYCENIAKSESPACSLLTTGVGKGTAYCARYKSAGTCADGQPKAASACWLQKVVTATYEECKVNATLTGCDCVNNIDQAKCQYPVTSEDFTKMCQDTPGDVLCMDQNQGISKVVQLLEAAANVNASNNEGPTTINSFTGSYPQGTDLDGQVRSLSGHFCANGSLNCDKQ